MISVEKARGCLLGLAVGDALGSPVRGLKSGRIAQLFGAIDGHIDAREAWLNRPHRWAMPGLHSALAQSALSVVDCFQAGHRVDASTLRTLWGRALHHPEAKSQRFGLFRNPSPAFAQSLRRLDEPESTGGRKEGPSCEAAILALPLAMIHGADAKGLTASIADLGLLLSNDPRAIAGALAVGHLCAALLEDVDPISAAETLIEHVRQGEEDLLIEHLGELDLNSDENEFDRLHAMSRALEAIPGLVREGDDGLAIATLMRQGHHLAPSAPMTTFNANHPLTTVPVLAFLALTHQRFAEPVSRVAGEGKEAALCAGLLGGLLGARLGIEAIPADWREGLKAQREVTALADALSGASTIVDTPWLDFEMALTSREMEARRPLIVSAEKERAQTSARRPSKGPAQPSAPEAPMPFPPPPQSYLGESSDPRQKQRERAARGRKRIAWKEERRRRRDT